MASVFRAAIVWGLSASVSAAPGDLSCDSTSVDHSKTVVVAVGDSITAGATCRNWTGGYVSILQQAVGGDEYDVRDCGVSGTDAVRPGHGQIHHPSYWSTSSWNHSMSMKPDVVIFMLGTNDADEWGPGCATCGNTRLYYQQDWKDMVNGYKELESKPKIVVMIPPPYMNQTCDSTCPLFNGTNKEEAKSCVINCELPKIVPELAKDVGVPASNQLNMLKLFGGPDNTDKSTMPSLHPNCAGYTVMGNYIARTLFPKVVDY